MDVAVIAEHLKRPPERVRLREMYPELPDPIPFEEAFGARAWNDYDRDPPELRGCWFISFCFPPATISTRYAVTAEHGRIAEEYYDARERQQEAEEACAAARWENRSPAGAPREPEPEAIPPRGELTPRQADFCRHYATQPVAVRAAVLAGYAESNADSYGPRLLKNPLVLERIAKLRHDGRLHYVVERDTMHDKIEAVFFDALGDRNHTAAVAALRLQAGLAGLSIRAAAANGEANGLSKSAAKKPGNAGVSPRQKPGKARTQRRKKPGNARKSP